MNRRISRPSLRSTACIALLAVSLAACSAAADQQKAAEPNGAASKDAKLTVALGSDVDLLDPHMFRTDAAYVVTANVYEPLLRQKYADEAGVLEGQPEVEPGLAERWEVTPDGKRAVFHLRKGAKFADGTPVTSADVAYTFKRAMLGPGYIAALLPFVGVSKPEQIQTPDAHTFVLTPTFKSPLFERFLTFQVFGAINQKAAKAHSTAADPWATAWLKDNVTASGAYQVKELNRGQQAVLAPNPGYYDAAALKNGGVTLKSVPDPDQRALLLRSGDIDVADSLPPRLVSQLKSDDSLTVNRIPSSRITYLGMNNTVAPLNDKLVRQAISYAVPYQDIIDKVQFGYASMAKGPVPPAMRSAAGDQYWHYDTNAAKARELLKQAGKTHVTTQLAVREAQPQDTEAAVFIQEALRQVGVDVEIQKLPDATYYKRLNEHSLPMFLHDWFSWGEDPFFQMGFLLKSKAFTNYANYSNPAFDALLQKGTFELDPGKRDDLSKQAQKLAIDDAPWAFLYSSDYLVVTRKGVSGVTRPFDQTLRFEYLSKTG
ncbi:ABC transporter substrate-binding protein [Terrabacter terrigena]|uniref:ABC transporter substrate-binding protein n=1 Tax=Terrabacter terrigena TaxID=574718 RepID=A0ABW3MVA8_9MICO